MTGTIIIAAVVFVLVFGSWATTLVRQYQKGLLETFGKYSRTLEPGLNFIFPMAQRVRKIDMRERTLDVPRQDVITKDNASVTVDAIVYYKPTDAKKVEYEVEDFEQAAVRLAQTNLRSEIGEMDLDESLS
ncbi:MAG: SPFH domain-containing protein, partial [Candidatus Acetothermia bacterium]